MCSDVTSEVTGADEAFRAVGTFVGLLSRVRQHMPLKVGELCKSPRTNLAGVGLFSGMNTVMNLEMSSQDESLWTFLTFVRLLS